MPEAFICDAVRTPIGRYAGALRDVRADDLAAIPIRALKERNPNIDWAQLDDVVLGCANQAGEDNRDVARMAVLLAGLGQEVPGTTLNRLCGSGMDAVSTAARAIKAGEAHFYLAGGVESMTRAPFVMGKSATPFARTAEIFDTTIGWRFINKTLEMEFGVDSMPQTGENVAQDFGISRDDQDAFAVRSQDRAARALASGRLAVEITPVFIPQRKGDTITINRDEHPRATDMAALARLKPIVRPGGTVTAGNASGVNDGAAALLIASERGIAQHGLTPRARVIATSVVGVEPRIMGFGPAPASLDVLRKAGLKLGDIDLIELNEAFASQALAVLRHLGIADDADFVNPNGGAIALGHPLGMSGARLILTATEELLRTGKRYALCTMCIGVGQGIATIIERV